jgi:hypothetical protein
LIYLLDKTFLIPGLYIAPIAGNPDFIAKGTSLLKLIFVFWLPNLFWIVVPFAVICGLWNRYYFLPCNALFV